MPDGEQRRTAANRVRRLLDGGPGVTQRQAIASVVTVTRLALAGCSESEIAAITGHALTDVRSILDRHYLSRDVALAEAAIHKLEEHIARKSVKPSVKRSAGSGDYDAET